MDLYGSILVIGYHKTPLKTFVTQLHENRLHEYFEIEACTVSELIHSTMRRSSLLLVTSETVLTMIKPYLEKDTPYIIANRSINYSKIREILELPKNTEVLVASNMKDSAEETVLILQEIGIELNFQPYYPGANYDPTIKIAITPGSAAFVPSSTEKVIDIGTRFIDISSIIEIFIHFHITQFATNRLSARYFQSLSNVTSELSQEIFTTKMLRKSLQQIVNNIDDAVLLYTKDGCINVINQKTVELLQLHNQEIVGKQVSQIVSTSFMQAIETIEKNADEWIDIDQVTYYVCKKDILVDRQLNGTLVLFRQDTQIEKIEHEYRNQTKSKNFIAKYTFQDMLTENRSILEMIAIAKKLAKSDSTILILGESGTGKEIVGQAIHNVSRRAYYPFVGVNFASLSETLLESELFGYEGGAFTGATKDGRSGLFEQAHKGTIFLDEIGDASPTIQNRLLRVLQEKQILRVGGERVISLDVRVIAATNKDLQQLIEEGTFREDLFYRLNVLPIHLPPLRERVEDIILLTRYFIEKISIKLKRDPFRFSDAAFKALKEYHWPGNIRELQNTVEYLAHVVGDTVYKEYLPFLSKNRPLSLPEQNDKNFKTLINFFYSKGFLNDVATILELLTKKYSFSGRHVMLQQLEKEDIHLSEQQFRYRQQLLREEEMITVHRGRKGTEITEKGKDFLCYLNANRMTLEK